MKQFISFVQKEFRHIFRDRRTMLILIGIPIVQIVLFGFAITTEVRNINVAILDPSKDEATRQITEKLAASSYFHIIGLINHSHEIERIFLDGTADMVVAFDERFGEKLYREGKAAVQLIADATDPNTAITEINYVTRIIGEAHMEMSRTPAQYRLFLIYECSTIRKWKVPTISSPVSWDLS